jgi:hypothetical protein
MWNIIVEASGESFERMLAYFAEASARIAKAKSFKDYPFGSSLGSSNGSFSVTLNSPVEARIKALRDEANALEAELSRPL